MADRGQITGGVLDGPLAFDNAVDPEAARIKGIRSEVAGRAQILVVPDLEAGNMLAKNLSFLVKADAAEIVLGARVPIILTSRANFVPAPAWPPARWRSYMRTPGGAPRSCRPRDQHGNDPRRQCGLVEPRRCARSGGECGPAAADLAARSRVALYAIPTDEELMIARHTLSVLSRDAAVARRRFAS